ncbi:hypothetical protein [Treponema endosymbiont of Eucomonympha sp.]|uniref:hypothetical protein n=1 Tax=Treponema endosymbiont of Eucomonympha sp. TaxID=1580831 RepID=UPI000A8AEFF3|nr:hypothetical protein [Treponema endosymbiont of Eucomonympha sp.]
MSGDFIPHQDGAFLEWAKTLTSYVAAHLTGFNIQESALAPIQTLLADYQTAYDKAENPNRGKADVLAKNEARDALKAALRTFIKAYLTYNPEVTDVDKESMGLPLHDSTRTPVPAPSTIPEIELDSSVIRQISAHFRDSGSDRRGKPQGVHGVELRWALLDNPPSSVEDLTKSAFDTASPYIFTFDEADRGKALYICPRWENNKGDKGPLGEIVKAIVP